ncbi:MAG: pyridoxal phosphate-dependent aminotransferase [Lachnospiraceae bacterium]|jgi:aspartate aminotransferase|nr:pyridoxal phosphate-dependent aminotransferase [Lachnospiraceae bacterium]
MKISKKIQECALSPMRKFHPYAVKAEEQGKKIYKLNIGQPDIKTPEQYFDAVRNFEQPVLAYAPSPGLPEMVNSLVNYYKGIGSNFEAEDVIVTTGGSEALSILFACILDEGSEVIIPEPFYPNYNTMIRTAGGKITPIHTTPEEGYRYAVKEKIEACINENTRAIMVTNPGNPTGVVLTREEMQVIADIAKEHDIYVIGDEVYREFVYGGEPLASMSQIKEIEQNVVVVDSVSKRFSACGARIGALMSKNKELMGQAMKMAQARLSVATLDQVASAALYQCDSSYFDATREEYKKRRDTCYAMIKKIPGVVCAEPQGAFYMMAALPVDDADKFNQWLLEEFEDNHETVMFAPGGGFYTGGKGKNEVRIAYVLKQADLERAMELLGLGIAQYRKEVMGCND